MVATCGSTSAEASEAPIVLAPPKTKFCGHGGWGWLIVATLMAVSLHVAVGSTHAAAAVYWSSSNGGVGAANLDGTELQSDYFYWPYPAESGGSSCGVAINSAYLYWAGSSGIGRRRLEGEGIYPATVVPHLEGPCGLTLDGSHIYWGNPGGHPPSGPLAGSLGRANLDGSEATNAFVTGLERPCDVAVGGSHVFWVEHPPISEAGGIGRANLDGSMPQRSFIPFPTWNPSCGLTASGGYLYWGEGQAIARTNLDGGEVDDAFIPGTGIVTGIAVQSGYIYWAAEWPDGTSSIGRANLDGSEANPTWISSSERELRGIALDERPEPPPLTLPSRPIEILRNAEYNLRSGAALLGVYVPPSGRMAMLSPAQGQLTVTSRGLNWRVFAGTDRYPVHGNSYLWWVRVRPGRGAAGRRIRAQMRRRGWARVNVHLTYTTDRVFPVDAGRKLILRRCPGARSGWVKHPRPPRS